MVEKKDKNQNFLNLLNSIYRVIKNNDYDKQIYKRMLDAFKALPPSEKILKQSFKNYEIEELKEAGSFKKAPIKVINLDVKNEQEKLNPKNYVYEYSYRSDVKVKYTMFEDDKDKVYFVDTYAKSYPMEDRARIFENICGKDETTDLLNYPHLKDKALLIQNEILKKFPSLKDAKVFNSLNETK